MISGTRQLADRQARLRSRCTADRARACLEINAITEPLEGIDRGLERFRRWMGKPLVVVALVGGLLVVARSRSLRGTGVFLGLLSTALRVGSLSRWLRGPEPAAEGPGG